MLIMNNDSKKSFSFMIMVILCLVMIGIFVIPKISFDLRKQAIVKGNNFHSSVIADRSGNWTISQVIKDTDNVTLTDVANGTITSNSQTLSDNEVVLVNSISLEQGTNTMDIIVSGYYYYIDLSDIILDGFTAETNFDDNSLDVFDGTKLVAKLYMGDIVSDDYMLEHGYLDDGTVPFAWFYDSQDGFAIYNYENILVNDEYNRTFELRLDLDYATYKDRNINITASMDFDSDRVVSGEDVTVSLGFSTIETNPLTVSNVVKNNGDVYKKWNSAWGTEPEGDNYYIMYNASFDLAADGDYEMLITPNVLVGSLVAYGDASNFVLGDLDSYINSTYANAVIGNNSRFFIVAYAKPAESGTINHNFTMTINAPGVYSENINWSTTYNYKDSAAYPNKNANDVNLIVDNDNNGVGAINKITTYDPVTFNYTVESASNEINEAEDGTLLKGFNNWYASNEGANDYTATLEFNSPSLSDTYGDGGNEFALGSEDYALWALTILDDIEYDYKLDEQNDFYYLEEADINTYGDKSVYYKTKDSSDWILAGTYKKNANGEFVYTGIDDKVTMYDTTIYFPEFTTDVKVEYVGKRAMVYIGYDISIDLNATNDVIDYLNDNENTYLKVTASSNDDTENNYHKLTKLEMDADFAITSNNEGFDGTNNTVSYEVGVTESVPFPNGDVDLAYSALEDMEYGTFYFLLPRGAVLNGNVTATALANDVNVESQVSQEEGYNGSDRTLVKVVVYNDYGNYYEDSTKLYTGYNLSFNLNYSQVANRDYGNILKLDAMYSNSMGILGGYHSASDVPSETISEAAVAAFALADTSDMYNKLFANNTATVDPVTVSSGQAETYVKGPLDRDYGTGITIKEGYKYSYKLEYTYSDPLTNFNHLVFYDVLENAYGSNEHIDGTFDSVDTTYLQETLNINPTVYYSTKTDINLDSDYDLTNESVWTVDEPTDKTKVTAVAVDLGAREFDGINKQIPIVYVNMIGATNYTKAGVAAYNNSMVRFNDINSNDIKTSTSSTTQVTLQKGTFELNVVSKQSISGSTLSAGSLDFPTRVETNYGYLYTIKNLDLDYDYHNFNINAVIGNIVVDTDNISYYYSSYNDAVLISEDDMVTYNADSSNGSINLTVKEVAKNSSINIWLPVSIDMNSVTSDDAVIVNNSKLDRVEGKGYKGNTITLYNGVSVPVIDANKFIKNGGVFVTTDQEALKIGKGNTYTYMMKVQNNSDVVANTITVVDNVPSGLVVDESSITDGGVYDQDHNTITWYADTLSAQGSLELTYDVTVPSSIPNNTRYSSSGHVTVANPYNPNNLIYDKDTNTITIIYNTSADIVINNQVLGTLINENKEFTYTISVEAHSYDAGEYPVTDNENNELGRLVIDGDGIGSYQFTLTSGKKVTVRDLPAGVNYTIGQNNESGYTTLEPNNVLVDSNGVSSLTATTSDGMTANYIFNNTYRATGRANVVGKVTHEKDTVAGDFQLKIVNSDQTYSDIKATDENNLVHFASLNYEDEVGNYEYTVSQVIGDNERVEYDDNYYKVYVKVTDEGNGTLKTVQTYYDKYGNEVDEIVFNNKHIEVGLLIKNTYSGDYIIENKKFEYVIDVTADEDGTFDIMDADGNKIDDFVIDNGTGSYETTLGASEFILIKELPVGAQYSIKLVKQDHFDSSVDGGVNDGDYLVANGTIDVSTKKVIFDTVYNTEANYQPSINVVLYEKDLTDGEFEFKIEDISEQSSGYNETAKNDVDGLIDFSNITFNKPGTYTYRITQVLGTSNHIYYDATPVILTLVLTDNMDGTMDVQSTYTFVDNRTTFVNTYSEEPIVNENTNNDTNTNPVTGGSGNHGIGNPNTIDYIIALVCTLLGALFVTFIIRFIKVKKFNN